MTVEYSQTENAIRSRLWRLENPEKSSESSRKYYMKNKESHRDSVYKWIAEHLEYHTAYNRLTAKIAQAHKKGLRLEERNLRLERRLLQTTLKDRKQAIR